MDSYRELKQNAFRCCNEMLQKWLESDCNATWDKIWKAVESPAVTKAKLNCRLNDGKWQ